MIDKQALEALATRCEQATGADRALDKAIMFALMPDSPKKRRQEQGIEYAPAADPVTASVDAALTLVLEGLCLTVQERNVNDDHNWRYFVSLWNPTNDVEIRGKARRGKLALAITAAALRGHAARQEMSDAA